MGFSIILLSLILVYSGVTLCKCFKKKVTGQCCNYRKEDRLKKIDIQQADQQEK